MRQKNVAEREQVRIENIVFFILFVILQSTWITLEICQLYVPNVARLSLLYTTLIK
ncbi:hypothetical protein EXVG_00469 [Emiliania huxleyi virus 202]|nr:hypothetical protein EXVG_00469 [Emiliania huxleyi virus 202]